MATHFGSMVYSMGVPVIGQDAPLGGKHLFVRPAVGSDSHSGLEIDEPLDTLTKALALADSGKNDVIHIIGDGGTTGTVREDVAVTISESSLAIIGEGSPVVFGQRSRIAPSSATVGATKCPRSSASPRSRSPPARIRPSRRACAAARSNRSTARPLMTGPNQTSRRVTSPATMARVRARSRSRKSEATSRCT